MHVSPTKPFGARPGQYVRFDCFGRFLRVEDRPSNGLGLIYRVDSDGDMRRVFGL